MPRPTPGAGLSFATASREPPSGVGGFPVSLSPCRGGGIAAQHLAQGIASADYVQRQTASLIP